MNRLMLVCLFATIALSSWAQDHVINAPNFTLRLKQAADHQTLSLSGNFAAGDYNRAKPIFDRLDGSKRVLIVELNFGGGLDNPIETFARRLRRYCRENSCQIVTVIPTGAWCASYCIPIYMQGEVRATIAGGHFGFHVATLSTPIGTFNMISAMLGNYAQYGVSRAWLNENRRYFEQRDITALSPQELAGSNIVTHQFGTKDEFAEFVGRL